MLLTNCHYRQFFGVKVIAGGIVRKVRPPPPPLDDILACRPPPEVARGHGRHSGLLAKQAKLGEGNLVLKKTNHHTPVPGLGG